MKQYIVTFKSDGKEKYADTFFEALHLALIRKDSEGLSSFWIESDDGEADPDCIKESYSYNGAGNKEWVICINSVVKNTCREYAYIEEYEKE